MSANPDSHSTAQATRLVSGVERSVLALGVLLRLYLATVNAEANDDHQTVIRIIAHQHRLPGLRDAWEGFQPKFYHVTVAILWNLSPWQSSVVQVRIAQLVACAAGIATLFVVRRALARWALSAPTRTLTFALVALNPTLIGLNAQATNDSFVILFATVALAHAYEFFRVGTIRAFILTSVSVVLAALSKGNGLVIFIAISATLAHAIVRHDAVPRCSQRQLVGVTVGFVVMFLASTVALGSYRRNWQDTGNPFSINGNPEPFPNVFSRTYVYRPGTTSIADTYFTFRFVDMLAHPAITSDPRVYPLHRTSLWSQLYGRAHAVHFAQHPPSWRNTSPLVFAIARLVLVIALLPTALLMAGMLRIVGTLILPSRRRSVRGQNLNWELTALTATGFVTFLIVYSLLYRDFSTMKAEFLFPGLLASAVLFADEAERAQASYLRERWIRCGVGWAFAVLLALYVTDVVILAIQLT